MASDIPLAPDFIRYLFSTKPKFDCYFEVGNKSQGKPERIGAVKLMLMAHSEVFRLQLEESDLAEKGDVPVEDVHPGTFKGMLKYIYGHDTTPDMCFDDADNMLYVAEKYMIRTLKDKLAVRLMKLLNLDNICSLLNNPACYTHLQLDSAITEILRYETDRVLASPQFLCMNTEGFLKILEQDGLAVPEIELWRAAIKWAKHRANSDDGQQLRQQVSGLTRHLRLCTLTADEVCTEVVSTGVLSNEELGAVCISVGTKEKPKGLTEISNEIVPRKRLNVHMKQHMQGANGRLSMQKPSELKLAKTHIHCIEGFDYTLTILTQQHAIELLPLVCRSRDRNDMEPENWTYKVGCTTTITKVENPHNPDCSSTNEPPITVSFSENVKCGVEFEIPLAVDERNITLLPDTKYTVKMVLKGVHKRYICRGSGKLENDHLKIDITSGNLTFYYFPSDKLQYRVTTVD